MEPTPTAKPVLLVDDERDFREGIQQLLITDGFDVHTAVDGNDALKVLSTLPRPGLILLDLMMPGMNGHELLKELGRRPEYRDIPVVVLSAAPVTVRGVTAFLKKPPDLDELMETVGHFCSRVRPAK